MDVETSALIGLIALPAAIVTGALGYGFSTISVPPALMLVSSRVLNPALVLVEVGLNAGVLWVNRRAFPQVGRRVLPIVFGLVPGIIAGTWLLGSLDQAWLKFATFAVLLPLTLLQAAGQRRPIAGERPAGLIAGGGVGALYATTTISGPPLAVMLNNQGLAGEEFRAGLATVRVAESTITAVAYAWAGFFTAASAALLPPMLIAIAVGLPIGALIVRHVAAESFRRVAMAFDALIVSIALSIAAVDLRLLTPAAAVGVPATAAAIDALLLFRFFRPHSAIPAGGRL